MGETNKSAYCHNKATITSVVGLLGAAAVLAALPALGAPPASLRPQTQAEAVRQVDGMTERVVDQLWKTTDHYWHEGDYQRIIALNRICVEAEPDFFEAWASGAWLLWSQGDTPASDAFLSEGVRRNPGRYQLHYELGWHLYNTKRYPMALLPLQAAVRFEDAPSVVWKALGHCYDKLNRLEEAERVWETVVAKFPGDIAGPPNLRRIQEKKVAAPQTNRPL